MRRSSQSAFFLFGRKSHSPIERSGKNKIFVKPIKCGVGSTTDPCGLFQTTCCSASIKTPGHSMRCQPRTGSPPWRAMTLSMLLWQSPKSHSADGTTSINVGTSLQIELQNSSVLNAFGSGLIIFNSLANASAMAPATLEPEITRDVMAG